MNKIRTLDGLSDSQSEKRIHQNQERFDPVRIQLSENGIDTVSECTLQLINDAENYFDEDREIQNIKIERGRDNRNREINHFEQSSIINPEAIMRRLSSSPTRTSTPQISNFATPKRTPIRPQGMSLSQGHPPSCSRVASSLPRTPNATVQRTPLPFPTFREDQPVANQNSNSNISQNSTTSAICNGLEHMGIRELEHRQSLERIQEHPQHEHVRENHENYSVDHQQHQNAQSQGQSQSEFNLLYERLFDKIQNQEINSQDWSNLEHEYRIWVDQMDQNTKSLQDKLKALKNERETLSKAKTVLDKNRNSLSKSGEEMKKKQEGLASLVAQVSHLGLFLEQNSAVMKEAKRKSKEMNREEKDNILSLNKKLTSLLENFSKVKSKVDMSSNRVDENLNRLKTLIQKEDLTRAITLEKLDRQTTHLNDELNLTSSTLAKSEKDNEHGILEQEQLESKVKDLEDQIDQSKSSLEKFKSELSHRETDIIDLKTEQVNKTNVVELYEKRKVEIEKEVNDSLKSLEKMITQLEAARDRTESNLRSEISGLNAELIRLEEVNTVTKKSLNKQEFNLALLSREIEQVVETKSEKSAILNEIKSQMSQLDDLISEKHEDFDNDNREYENEKQSLQENKELLTSLKTQLHLLEDEITNSEKEITEWTESKRHTEGQTRACTDVVNALQSRLQALEAEIETKTAKNHEFRGLIDSKRHHTTFMLSELTNLATEKKSAIETSFEQTDELTANQNQLRTLSEKLINDQSEMRIIEDEISKLQSNLMSKEEMAKAFEELNREKNRLQGEIEGLKTREVEQKEEVKTSKDHLETLLKRIQEFQVYLETRQNTHLELEAELNDKDLSMIGYNLTQATNEEHDLRRQIQICHEEINHYESEINDQNSIFERSELQINHVLQERSTMITAKYDILKTINCIQNRRQELKLKKMEVDAAYRAKYAHYSNIYLVNKNSQPKKSEHKSRRTKSDNVREPSPIENPVSKRKKSNTPNQKRTMSSTPLRNMRRRVLGEINK